MKKFKAYSILAIVTALLMTLVFSSMSALTVQAASSDTGSEETARQKEWTSVLTGCLISPIAWRRTKAAPFLQAGYQILISAKALNDGKWFGTETFWADSWGGQKQKVYINPFMKKQVIDEVQYGDDKLVCGQKDSKLVEVATSALGVSYKDVICDYSSPGYHDNGVLLPVNAENDVGCGDVFDNGGDGNDDYFIKISDDAVTYMTDLVTNKTFNDNVPSGSLFTLTPVEEYILRRDAFTTECVMGEAHIDSPNSYTYQIKEKSGNSLVTVGYSGRTNPGKNNAVIYFDTSSATCGELADSLNEGPLVDAYKAYVESGEADENGDGDVDEEGDENSDPCYNTGIEGMSWILCPTINNTTKTVDGIEFAIRTMLSINSDQLFGDNNVTYQIWGTFRNIANTIIAIIFLVIIFSQLTGYGIDNYGIKKMLPKLIAMAIIVNLSYIICELAVDLSNILGVGLNNLFEGMAGDVSITTEKIVGGIIAAAAGAASASGIIVSIVGLASGGGGVILIIPLVLALLSALVAVLMFFVMLGARMIIVVVFTTVSPIAFALYILPNTQNLFKKWWKVFEAALVVFPICGALYGASYIIKAIIIGDGNDVSFFMAIAGVMAPFLPFFALPSLLKGALAGLGAISGAITSAGSGIRRGLAKGSETVKGTERYKSAQQENNLNRLIRSTGIDPNTSHLTAKGEKRYNRAQSRGGAAARLMNARISAVKKGLEQRREDASAYTEAMAASGIPKAKSIAGDLLDADAFGAGTIGAYYGGQMIEAARHGNTESLDATISAAKAGGMKEKDIAKVLRQIFKGDDRGRPILSLSQEDRAAYGRRLASQNGSIVGKDLELKHHLQTGSDTANAGAFANQGDYFIKAINNNKISAGDYNEDDWIGADMGTIAAGISSGLLTKEMAERIQAKNPNLDPEKLVAIGLAADGTVGKGQVVQDLITGAKDLANHRRDAFGISHNSERVKKYIESKGQKIRFS